MEKLKQKIVNDILIFQNEEHLKETEIRQDVDSVFYVEDELSKIDESEFEEEVEIEVESKSKESKYETEEECSEEELNEIDEMIKLNDD